MRDSGGNDLPLQGPPMKKVSPLGPPTATAMVAMGARSASSARKGGDRIIDTWSGGCVVWICLEEELEER